MDIRHTVAVVTGGASGLGRATARRLAEHGAKVVLADLASSPGEQTAAEIGDAAWFSPTDVTSEEAVTATLDGTIERFGKVNAVISCAGIGIAMKTLSRRGPHPLELFQKVLTINTVGTFNVLRLAAARMADNEPNDEGERGVIVNTASVAAFDGQIGQAAYAASKGAVVGMMLPIARDLARSGIRVCTIAPGIFDTPMLASLPDEVRATLAANVPFPHRLGRPEEFGQLAQHILENSMLNAEVIRLDGALRMPPK